jgi:hypothetical protein
VERNKGPFLYVFISGCVGDRLPDNQKEGGGEP